MLAGYQGDKLIHLFFCYAVYTYFLIVSPTLPVYTLFLDTVPGNNGFLVFIYITVYFNGILVKLVGHFISAWVGHFI